MKEVNIKSTFFVFDDLTETPLQIQNLMKKAMKARENAYAPYSKFHVGSSNFVR